ncbi:MAG: bifunctional precorrin-2 dehydrogenase/sirohydrochlorin ferrochelatase [Candidatus Adiutrix sp.]|jgi:precorrin-2 dehydrogenase/sirohydrochlorin ferrochelatase|nr:bifunctional precorrin-2 dehydrogenase/sirohydrochlorin ferrochelatase [Candidatus Adiutrix sp.]
MFPINLHLAGRKVLILGAGQVGRRKLAKLLRAGALVTVVEKSPDQELTALAREGFLELSPNFRPELLEGAELMLAASSDAALNQEAAALARSRGIWVNLADCPELSDFTLPALVEQGDFLLAVSTGGGSPALAAAVAVELRQRYGPEYGLLSSLLGRLRPQIMASDLTAGQRKAVFSRLAASEELRQALAAGAGEKILPVLEELLKPLRPARLPELIGNLDSVNK